jgi:hypothetical protein
MPCQAYTKKKQPCQIPVGFGVNYCHYHAKSEKKEIPEAALLPRQCFSVYQLIYRNQIDLNHVPDFLPDELDEYPLDDFRKKLKQQYQRYLDLTEDPKQSILAEHEFAQRLDQIKFQEHDLVDLTAPFINQKPLVYLVIQDSLKKLPSNQNTLFLTHQALVPLRCLYRKRDRALVKEDLLEVYPDLKHQVGFHMYGAYFIFPEQPCYQEFLSDIALGVVMMK